MIQTEKLRQRHDHHVPDFSGSIELDLVVKTDIWSSTRKNDDACPIYSHAAAQHIRATKNMRRLAHEGEQKLSGSYDPLFELLIAALMRTAGFVR